MNIYGAVAILTDHAATGVQICLVADFDLLPRTAGHFGWLVVLLAQVPQAQLVATIVALHTGGRIDWMHLSSQLVFLVQCRAPRHVAAGTTLLFDILVKNMTGTCAIRPRAGRGAVRIPVGL